MSFEDSKVGFHCSKIHQLVEPKLKDFVVNIKLKTCERNVFNKIKLNILFFTN